MRCYVGGWRTEVSDTHKTAAPKSAPKPVLARASESGDPAVHQLIAEMATARLNGDADRLAKLTERLAGLGYC